MTPAEAARRLLSVADDIDRLARRRGTPESLEEPLCDWRDMIRAIVADSLEVPDWSMVVGPLKEARQILVDSGLKFGTLSRGMCIGRLDRALSLMEPPASSGTDGASEQ